MVKQDWSNEEKFFARSWSHIFYFWKLRQIMLAKTVRNILRQRQGDQETVVIDLGCGPGTNVFDVYDASEDMANVRWFGLDLNQQEAAMGAARSKYRNQGRHKQPIHFMSGDIFQLPFADNSVDILISSEVVEHLPDPVPALQEMQRVLKPNGYAMVTTPNPRNLPEMLGYALDKLTFGGFKKFYWKGQDEVSAPPLDAAVGFGHVSVHPYPVWRDWFQQVGLPVVKQVRGPIVFGSPFFDRQRFLLGMLVMLDPILDKLPLRFLTTTNLGMLCKKQGK
ncbi:MAG: class I SAM-dependent methyltransferase [Mariprofundaceae bacterium]|nr:class I SAM-dependent methyltransferase [Mariprofundaceae bacterium]